MKIPDEDPTLEGSNFMYSLRCDDWESYDGFSEEELEIFSVDSVLVHEQLHYAASWGRASKKKKAKCIAAFNLDSKGFEFDMLPLPEAKFGHDHAYHQGDSSFQLSAMDGCLCAWAKYRDGSVQMWVLKQYGKWDSWTKVFSLNMFLKWGILPRQFFGYSPTGKVLVRTDCEGFVLVNIDKCGSKYVCVVKQDSDMEEANFVGSLLSPFNIAGSLRKE